MANVDDVSEKVLDSIAIQVCFASAQNTTMIDVTTKIDSTIREAIEISQILTKHPEVNLDVSKVGIFGKLKSLNTILKQGDRVEIYRPLSVDPMVARRRRFAKQLKK